MGHPFEHPSARNLLQRVAQAFSSDNVYLVADRQLLFVCGGPVAENAASIRKKFIETATATLHGFRIFLAETAAQDVTHHADPKFLNIADFERLLADVADCIVIFPETPGSLTELGFFAALEPIRQKCLVVNHFGYQGQESFINNGPLALIDTSTSVLRPTIHIDLQTEHPNFQIICDRLSGRLAKRRRKRINVRQFGALDAKSQLAVIEELIYRFKILNVDGLMMILSILFESTLSEDQVREFLSILISSKYVTRTQEDVDFFSPREDVYRLLSVDGVDTEGLSVAVVDFYQTHAPDIYRLLEEPAHDY